MALQIFPIKVGINRCYLIRDKGTILVDTGYWKSLHIFQKAFKEAGIDPAEISLIILTHGHFDHMGCATNLKNLTGAEIVIHTNDLKYLEKLQIATPPGATPWGKWNAFILRPFFKRIHDKIPVQKADIVLGDEDYPLHDLGIQGRIVFTPGHTPGSISVLLDSGEAFVGCMAHNNLPFRLSPGLPIFAEDIAMVRKSWNKIFASEAKTIYPGHGDPFPLDVMKKALKNEYQPD